MDLVLSVFVHYVVASEIVRSVAFVRTTLGNDEIGGEGALPLSLLSPREQRASQPGAAAAPAARRGARGRAAVLERGKRSPRAKKADPSFTFERNPRKRRPSTPIVFLISVQAR